jgi:hypothetical protein
MREPVPCLFEVGHQALLTLRTELAACGAPLDSRLELRRGNGLLCHYDLGDGHIYLAAPDPATAQGKFQLLLLRALIRCDSTDELLRFLELITPWLVAHEVAHHLRHKAGRFGPPLAEEERIASQFALTFVKHYLTVAQQTEIRSALAKGIANLADGLSSIPATKETDPSSALIHHVYTHMNRFYQGLVTPEEHQIADLVQRYLKP